MSFITAYKNHGFVGSGEMLRVFKIGEKTEPKEAFSWDQLQPELIKKPDFEEEKALKSVEKRQILCLAHANTHQFLAVGTNEKQIHVIEYFLDADGEFERCQHLITAVVPKAPTALAFDREDAYIVVGDRAGDVHRFSISEGVAGRTVELAGAISMILDIGFTPSGKQLLMADRDEKMRVMRYPETYVIDGYCLGHTDYVKTLACESEDIVWTAGGDKKVLKWSLSDPSKPLATIDFSEHKDAVRKIVYNQKHKCLAIIFEISDRLIFADVSEDGPARQSTFQILREGSYLDLATLEDKFVVLGRDNIIVFEASNLRQQHVKVDDVLAKSLKTEDAVQNLYKNVAHMNVAEYMKRKAERQAECAKKQKEAEDYCRKHYPESAKLMLGKNY